MKLGPDPVNQSAYANCTQEPSFDYSNSTSAKNQITASGFAYDAAGNLTTSPGPGTVTYDAENRLTYAQGQTYVYDGDGKRVEKATGSPLAPVKLYWYGIDDSPVLETDANGNELDRYFRFQGILVTREENNDWVDHYGVDALGNVRWVYSCQSWKIGLNDQIDYYPFGGERAVYDVSGNTRKFTSKERDSESALDYFGARYYGSSLGRFMSPDWSDEPEAIPFASLDDPQTLNLYTYGQNNPLNLIDEDGHDDSPTPAGKCTNFLCWLKFVFLGDPHNTRQDTNPRDPVGPVVASSLIMFFNFGNRVFGVPRQDAYFAPNNPQQAHSMQLVGLGLVFVPGLDVDELAAQLAQGVKPVADGAELQSIIDELYQPADTIAGGTAGAVRAERTGIKVGGKIHTTKAAQRARQLSKLISRGKFTGTDLALAKAIVQDLLNALAGK